MQPTPNKRQQPLILQPPKQRMTRKSRPMNLQRHRLVQMRRQTLNKSIQSHHHRLIIIIHGFSDLIVERAFDVVLDLQFVQKEEFLLQLC